LENNAPRILIVDDDPTTRFMAREVLEWAGFVVGETDRGDLAVESFLRLEPDIVMLDVIMPGMDGFQVCEALRALPGGDAIPLVMMTGLNDDDSVKKAYEAGATQFISKPIHWANLGHQMNYILRAKKTLERLRDSETRLAEAQRIAGIGSWELDTASGEMHWSEEIFRIFGMDETAAGSSFSAFMEFLHPLDRVKVTAAMRRVISGRDSLNMDFRIINRMQQALVVHAEAQIRRDAYGRPVQAVGYIQDVTERRRAEEKIRRLAYFDSLTGLPNRVHFTDHFDQALERSRRMGRKFSLLFMDLDRFKSINDSYGHAVGDELLKQVAQRLLSCVRTSDQVSRDMDSMIDIQVSRLAGDEFLVLVENIDEYQDAAKVAHRILAALSAPYLVDGFEISVTPCIGISLYPLDGEDKEELIRHADMAMYQVKTAGGGNFSFYSEELNNVAIEQIAREDRLRSALAGEEFSLWYQPVLDVESGRLVCVEALLRWDNPEKGVLLPAEFLPLAEKCGFGGELDEWVLRKAARQIKSWLRQSWGGFRISVNISGLQLGKTLLLSLVQQILDDTGIEPACLGLEFKENALENGCAESVETLRSLRKKGVRLAVDNFGASLSSLSQLQRFSIDMLKIDKSVIANMMHDRENLSLVHAIIASSQALGLDIVASGVERQEQRERLLSKGCRKMQGYFVSPPMTASDLEILLQAGCGGSVSSPGSGRINCRVLPP
jgi:diguanylate cyclase (GGDEF)-like protein/PAS domain S-box-containing protein